MIVSGSLVDFYVSWVCIIFLIFLKKWRFHLIFFPPISPVHSHPLSTKVSLIGSRNHMIRFNTNRSKTQASCTKRKSHGINVKWDGSFGTFGTFDTFGQSGVHPATSTVYPVESQWISKSLVSRDKFKPMASWISLSRSNMQIDVENGRSVGWPWSSETWQLWHLSNLGLWHEKAHSSVSHLLLDVEDDDGYGDGHGDEDDDAHRHQNGRPVAFDVVARHGILNVNISFN